LTKPLNKIERSIIFGKGNFPGEEISLGNFSAWDEFVKCLKNPLSEKFLLQKMIARSILRAGLIDRSFLLERPRQIGGHATARGEGNAINPFVIGTGLAAKIVQQS